MAHDQVSRAVETTMIFQEGLALPDFAAFDLFRTAAGAAALAKYLRTYAALARKFGTGFILESATWRASADWGARLGYSRDALADANRSAIALLEEVRPRVEEPDPRHVEQMVLACASRS